MPERRVVGVRTLALAAFLATALAPAASLPAHRTGVTAGAADPPASSAMLLPAGSGPAAGCDAQSLVADPGPIGATEAACGAPDLERDQAYLVETARPGRTMRQQGLALAVVRLHPMFVRRLAGAISEARAAGLPSAGIFSAYRPPAFGVGRFADKFNSLHAYGLAVDMLGIGGPGSSEAKLWYEIAARHGIVCPYGAGNRREWNHCQPTPVKSITAGDPLRDTVWPPGPIDLAVMFAMGDALVDGTVTGAESPDEPPVIDDKLSSHHRGQPLANPSLTEPHRQPTRLGMAENAAGKRGPANKSGPVKNYRLSSLARHDSSAAGLKAASSHQNAHAKRSGEEDARVGRMLKGICRGC